MRYAIGKPIIGCLVTLMMAACSLAAQAAEPAKPAGDKAPPRMAAIVTTYFPVSHADVIVSRLLKGYTLDGKGASPRMRLASLYTDQVHKNDISRKLSKEYGFPIYDKVQDALTLGTGKLAVDGVLLVAEHGDYPQSKTGQTVFPKRRLFEQVAKVFEANSKVVPIFSDKHLADNWDDAKFIYDTCRRLKIPLMAGSSIPQLWRYPAIDVKQGTKLKELVAVSYHTLDAYGFHALEMVQCLAERRAGGETGVKAVQCLVDDAVWEAGRRKVYDPELFAAAMARLERPIGKGPLRERVPHPVLWVIHYADGLKASILTLNYAVGEWTVAWRESDEKGKDQTQATLFWTHEEQPFMHFAYLLQGVDRMMETGKPAWPVERTLMTSGLLDALLISKLKGGPVLDTPQLGFSYTTDWTWRQPPRTGLKAMVK
jgi:hypothetical protein